MDFQLRDFNPVSAEHLFTNDIKHVEMPTYEQLVEVKKWLLWEVDQWKHNKYGGAHMH